MERREQRSDDKNQALQLFLEAQVGKLDVDALTVTTLDGRMIAGAGVIPRELARATIAQGEAETEGVATWRLRAGGEWLVIASWGGRLSYDVGSGVRRILS